MLLDVAPPAPLAPPTVSLEADATWRAERLFFQRDAVAARSALVDVQLLCASLACIHVLGASFWRRSAKRSGRHLSSEELPPTLAFSYFHSFALFMSLAFVVLQLAARAAHAPTLMLAHLPPWAVFLAASLYQTGIYMLTRIAQRNFTLGELAIVASIGTAALLEVVAVTKARLTPQFVATLVFREPTVLLVFQQALIFGTILIGFMLSPILVLSRVLAQRPTHRLRWPDQRNLHRRLLALAFLVLTVLLVLGVLGPWMWWQLRAQNPWLYSVRFMLLGSRWWSRLALLGYWGILCNIALLSLQLMVNRVWPFATVGDQVRPKRRPEAQPPVQRTAPTATERASTLAATQFAEPSTELDESTSLGPALAVSVNGRRKFFHALAVFLFVPGIAWDPAFMHLAFSIAFALFLFCECLRYCAVFPVGASLHIFMAQFLDNKDAGLVILSHLYLLSGCAAGLWADSRTRVAQQLGVLVLGIGDSCASIVGRQYGRLHWPRSKKTVEGTVAFVASTVLCTMLLRILHLVEPFRVGHFTLVAVGLALVEGISEQNDNLVLPLIGLLLCSLFPVV